MEYYSPLADANRIENWQRDTRYSAGGDPYTVAINPITGQVVEEFEYLRTAATPEALAYQIDRGLSPSGYTRTDQNIRDFFANNPSEFDTVATMVKYGVSEADIQRATGKTLSEIYAPQAAAAQQPWWVGQFANEVDANYVDTSRNQQIEESEWANWRAYNDPNSVEYKNRIPTRDQWVNSSGLDTRTGTLLYENLYSGPNAGYTDPVKGTDLTQPLATSLSTALKNQGITSFDQIEARYIPAEVDYWDDGYVARSTPARTIYVDKNTGNEIDPVLFDDKAGTRYVLTESGIQKDVDPGKRIGTQIAALGYLDPTSTGGAWTTQSGQSSGPGFGVQGMLTQIGQRLQSATGIQDINQLGLRTIDKPKEFTLQARYGDYYSDPYDGSTYPVGPQIGWNYITTETDSEGNVSSFAKPVSFDAVANIYTDENGQTRGTVPVSVTEIYNKATGQSIREGAYIDLGGWGEGEGVTYANLMFDANGKPKVSTWGSDSSDLGTILPALAILAAPFTFGGSLAGLGGEAALLAAESGIAAGGLGIAGLEAGALGLGSLGASELALADMALGGAGGTAGAAGLGSLPTLGSITSTLTSALPAELVEAGRTLYSTFNQVKPYLQAGNAVYQASQGNLAGAIASGLGAAGDFGIPGAKDAATIFNAGYAASQGNPMPAIQAIMGQTGIGSELANTKIAGDFTLGDAFKGAGFLQAVQTGDPTQILNAASSLTGSQDLKIAAAANSFVNVLNNPNATAFDIAMGADRLAGALNTSATASAPKGGLAQSTVSGAAGNDTVTGGNVIDEYNVVSGGLPTSANPAEDELIGQQQRVTAANQAISDYLGPGNDLSREGLVSQLQTLGFSAADSENYAKQADSQIEQRRVATDVMSRYSKIDPKFGTPALDRQTAVTEMVAAGFSKERADELLNGIDAQNAIKLENKLSVQSAYQDFLSGKGTEEQLRSALTSAGYNDTAINDLVTRGRGVIEGQKLTPGEGAQERAATLPDIRAEAAAKPTFDEAYALAREKLGAGATFNYGGKLYSTATAEENPALSGKPILTTKAFDNTIQDGDIASRLNMGLDANDVRSMINQWNSSTDAQRIELLKTPAYAGIKAIYDEKAVTRPLTPQEIATVIRTGSFGSISETPETNWVLAGRDLAGAIQDTVALVTGEPGNTAAILNRAGGEMLSFTGGALQYLGATDLGKQLTLAGKTISDIGESTSNYAAAQQAIAQKLDATPNWGDKAIELGKFALDNPGAVGDWIATEGLQEGFGLLAYGAARTGKLAAGLLADGLEALGSAYNDARQSALDAGKPITEADRLASKAASLSTAATLATAGVLDAKSIRAMQDFKAGRITQEALKESFGGGVDEGLTAAIIQQITTGRLDPSKIGTAAALGSLIEGGTSGSLSTVGQGVYDNIASASGDAQVTKDVVNTAIAGSLEFGQPADKTISTIVVGALNAGSDPATVVNSVMDAGIKSGVDTSSLASATTISALNGGADTATVVSSVISSGATKGDVSGLVSSTVTSALSTGADASTVIFSAVTAAVGGSQLSTETATVSAVSSAVTAGVKSGADIATVVNAAVSAAVTNSGGNQEVIASSLQTSVAAATTAGGNVSTVVSSAVNTAVNNGVNSPTAAASAVAGVIATGGNVNAAVEAARTSSGVQIATSVQGSRTMVTATDGNTVTKTVVDTTNNVTVTSVTDLSTNQTISTVTDTQTQQDITALQQTATQIKTELTTQINTLAKTNSDADKIIKDSIQKVADDLGISKTELLDKIGATETSLKAELSNELAQVSQNLNKQIKGLKTGLGTSAALAAAQPIRGISLDNDWLKGQMLKAGKAEGYRDPLAQFQALQEESQKQEMLKQIDPELANVLAERGTPVTPYYSYGEEQPIEDVLGMGENREEAPVFRSGGLVSPLNIQMMYAKGGRMREDFRHGKHVEGEGDGQSDDIPAWLADGEFVFPADVVSALGNGSTKAGTDKLYEMMHAIRDRARSKGPKDLPPPALKSPLDYLKKGR